MILKQTMNECSAYSSEKNQFKWIYHFGLCLLLVQNENLMQNQSKPQNSIELLSTHCDLHFHTLETCEIVHKLLLFCTNKNMSS